MRNLRWLLDAPQQITRICTPSCLRSALRLAAATFMVSACSMTGSAPPVGPALVGATEQSTQRSLDSVDSHSIDVRISFMTADDASSRPADRHLEAGEQQVRRERQARRERLARRARLARHERLARQGRVLNVQATAPTQVSPIPKTLEASAISKTTDASDVVKARAEMTTVDSLFFSANQAVLVVPSAPLDAVVALLEANPAGSIVLEGHADTNEIAASTLSWRRAQGARDYLLQRGVPGYRVRIRSQGTSRPSTIDAREVGAQNRRVALLLKTDKS